MQSGDWLVTDLWLEWTWIVTELHGLVVCLSLGHEDLPCPEKMKTSRWEHRGEGVAIVMVMCVNLTCSEMDVAHPMWLSG